MYISIFVVLTKEVNNFNKTSLKHIVHAQTEFRSFEFVIFKFIVVYMNIK